MQFGLLSCEVVVDWGVDPVHGCDYAVEGCEG